MRFYSDPSTVNKHPAHHDNNTFDRNKHWQPGPDGSPDHGWWNPEGRNLFWFDGVTVRSAKLADGSAVEASDPILGCRLGTKQPPGRIVDLDPDQQLVSMIFGVVLELVGSDGVALQGAVEPLPFTDIWRRGESGSDDQAASAAYQSVISVSSWGELSASEFLQQLRQAAGGDMLSIQLQSRRVLDGLRPRAGLAKGRVVETVGPAGPHEPGTSSPDAISAARCTPLGRPSRTSGRSAGSTISPAVQAVGAEIEPGSKTIAGQRTEVIRP